MSLKNKRRTILLGSEIHDLYGAPKLTFEQKRYYFSLNDLELDTLRSIRDRYNRIYFVLLLGYFKIKPVILNIRYADVHDDLLFIASELFPGVRLKRKNLSPAQKTRIYRRIFQLLDYQPFVEESEVGLRRHAETVASASIESRFLFDESIEYLAKHRIAIPRYTVLQRVVSKAIASERQRLANTLSRSISQALNRSLDAILGSDTSSALNSIRQSARNFSVSELEKELRIHQHIEPLIDDLDSIIQRLELSLSNLNHFSSIGARACHADEQIDQLGFRCGLQQGGQRIILFAFFRHVPLLGELKLNDLAQQWKGLHPILATQKFIGSRFQCRQS